jgi:hypothetical protein
MTSIETGTRVGLYEIVEQLGRTGMAAVHIDCTQNRKQWHT